MSRRITTGPCELCGSIRDLSFHHLIPRKLHRRARYRKNFTGEMLAQGINVCLLCHRGLHKLHDEMTLAKSFSTSSDILADPALSQHIAWSAKQKLFPESKT